MYKRVRTNTCVCVHKCVFIYVMCVSMSNFPPKPTRERVCNMTLCKYGVAGMRVRERVWRGPLCRAIAVEMKTRGIDRARSPSNPPSCKDHAAGLHQRAAPCGLLLLQKRRQGEGEGTTPCCREQMWEREGERGLPLLGAMLQRRDGGRESLGPSFEDQDSMERPFACCKKAPVSTMAPWRAACCKRSSWRKRQREAPRAGCLLYTQRESARWSAWGGGALETRQRERDKVGGGAVRWRPFFHAFFYIFLKNGPPLRGGPMPWIFFFTKSLPRLWNIATLGLYVH